MPEITYDDFDTVEIRTGTIIDAQDFPKARKPAYKLTIDFGELGIRRSSAQITGHYSTDDLIGRQILAVTNFPPRQIADVMSEVLVLGVIDTQGKVVLLTTEREVANGLRVS